MSEPKFRVGEVVQLVSGGPPMCVVLPVKRMEDRNGDISTVVHCQWFSVDGTCHFNNFHPDTLKLLSLRASGE